MRKKQAFEFYDPIYHIGYYFCLGDWKKFDKECKKFGIDNSNSSRQARCCFASDGQKRNVFIFLEIINTPSLAHEACHAAISVFNDIGASVNHETDENFAYYVQWIVGTILVSCKVDIQ